MKNNERYSYLGISYDGDYDEFARCKSNVPKEDRISTLAPDYREYAFSPEERFALKSLTERAGIFVMRGKGCGEIIRNKFRVIELFVKKYKAGLVFPKYSAMFVLKIIFSSEQQSTRFVHIHGSDLFFQLKVLFLNTLIKDLKAAKQPITYITSMVLVCFGIGAHQLLNNILELDKQQIESMIEHAISVRLASNMLDLIKDKPFSIPQKPLQTFFHENYKINRVDGFHVRRTQSIKDRRKKTYSRKIGVIKNPAFFNNLLTKKRV